MTKSLPKHYVFLFFIVVVLWKYHAAANFLYVAVKASKMALVFGECGRECLSRPGNTATHYTVHRHYPSCHCTPINTVLYTDTVLYTEAAYKLAWGHGIHQRTNR